MAEYCGRHSIHYSGGSCPRCDAEDRHKELLDATEESAAETAEAIRESDYRRANPGDYECPHCRYTSLRNGASRCPLCRGEIGNQYWSEVRATERVTAARLRAKAEADAAEESRAAPIRAALELQRKIEGEDEAIAAGWKVVGLSVLGLGGVFLGALICSGLANHHVETIPPSVGGCIWMILGVVGAAGTIILGLGLYLGLAILAVLIMGQVVMTVVRKARIARLQAAMPREQKAQSE